MSINGIKFRPVMGREDAIGRAPICNGYVYVATDTGNIYLDEGGLRKSIGGNGGSSGGGNTGFIWANGDEDEGTIVKMTPDASDGDPTYYFSPDAIDGAHIVPPINTLILNGDGRFFRVVDTISPIEGMVTVELIAVSGGGSGGGGGSTTADLDLSWTGIDLLGSTYVYQKDNEIAFIPNSTADEICSLTVTVTDETEAEVFKRDFRVRNGTKCIINTADFPVSNNLTVSVLVISDHSTYNRGRGLTKTFKPIKVLQMYLTKPIDVGMIGIQTGQATLGYLPFFTGLWTSQNPVKIYYNVDGGEGVFYANLIADNDQNRQFISIPHQPHGTHIIGLWLSVKINGQEFTSEEITYEVPFVDSGNEEPIIWIQNDLGTIVRYEPAVVNYMVYSSVAALTGAPIEVQFLQDGVLFDTSNIAYGNRWQSLDLTGRYVVGDNHFTIVSGGVSKDIEFYITDEGARNLSLEHEDDLEFNFDTLGRSNKQIKANRISFVSSVTPKLAPQPYAATLSNFNWYNNGWLNYNDDNGSFLSVSNGSSVSIPMSTIAINGDTPWTFEIRFRVRNAKKFATLITEIPIYVWIKSDGTQCKDNEELPLDEIEQAGGTPLRDADGNLVMNEKNTTRKIARSDRYVAFKYLNADGLGFAIGTQEAYFNVGGKIVNVKYREDEIINISFIIDKAKNQLSIYLNGILSGVGNLSGISAFTMQEVPFLINSEYCDFDLFKFRAYPLALTMPEVIHNYISDIKNTDLYDENQLTDVNDSTKLSYQRLIDYNTNHADSPTMPYVVIDMTGETSTNNTELPYAKTATGIDGARIEFTNPTADYLLSQESITPWQYYTHCPSYTANNVNINVQGTSSQIYPRRNFKTKFKKAKNWIYTAGPLAGKPVNYTYYFENDGSITQNIIDSCVNIQNEIAELEKNKEANKIAIKDKKNELKALKTGRQELAKNWHEDSVEFGTNKFTWKIDYMESSGSYNTGFANLLGNNVYTKHPLDDLNIDGSGYRTSVYGFPMLAFHKTAANQYTYIGRYNCNLDKSSNERYGFELETEHPYIVNPDDSHPLIADVAECWELRDNQGLWCSFRYPTSARATKFETPISENDIGIEVVKHFEARYHKDADQFEWGQNEIIGKENSEDYSMEVGTDKATINSYLLNRLQNLQVLFDWLDSTDTQSATNRPLSEVINEESVTYQVSGMISSAQATEQGITYFTDNSSGTTVNKGTFTKDTVEYRRQKFYNEFTKHLDLHYCAVYFVMTELLLCYDSRGKNMMMATFGPHEIGGDYIWYPIFYDIDTQLGLNNVGAPLWGYDEDCTENNTFSTATSVLWTNFNSLFKSQIISTYRTLRGSGNDAILSYRTIDGAYMCDPNVFQSSYAMRGRRPIVAMGLDIYYKYVLPVTQAWRNQEGNMITANYLYACQGDRKLSRQLLINNRLLYMDSKWLGGTFTISTGGMAGIMFRSTANHETTTSDHYIDLHNTEGYEAGDNYDLTVEDENHNSIVHHYVYQPYKQGVTKYIDSDPVYKVTPYLNFYITTFTDENTFQNDEPYSEERFPNGMSTKTLPSVEESYQYGRVDQQLNYFAGSSYISSLGDLSTKYANQIKIPNTPRLLDITLGNDHPDYFNNETLDPFELYTEVDDATGLPIDGANKSLLTKIILSHVKGAGAGQNKFLDVRSPEKLKEFRALDTSLEYVLFAEGAPLDTVHLPNTTTKILFTQNKNLTRILTSAPVVADVVNNELVYRDPNTYKGLYIQGITDYDGVSNNGQNCPIDEINMEGDAMGYDSYKILKNVVLQKNGAGRGRRLRIKMTDVNWTPYTLVEYGEDKKDSLPAGQSYKLLTDHSTYINYTNPGSSWADDTLNGRVYIYDSTAPRNTITDLTLLDIFLADYADTSTSINQFTNNTESEISNKTYPALSGELFVANGNGQAISEADLSNKYARAWPNLVIRAESVDYSYLTKYVEIDANSGKEIVLDNKAFSATNEVSIPPASRMKAPTRTHYDFVGFSPSRPGSTSDPTLYVVKNQTSETNWNWELTSAGQQATVDGTSKVLVLYAIFVPHAYNITYVLDIDNNSSVTVQSPYGSPIVLPETVPYKDESSLALDKKYAFLGWGYTAEATIPIDLSRINVNRNMTLYAIFEETSVHANPIDSAYLQLSPGLFETINGENIQGYSIGLNPNYTYRGKITLPSYIDNVPVLAVMEGTNNPTVVSNGLCFNNQDKNAITHIFWDTSHGKPVKLLEISSNAFYGATLLKYVEMPDSLERIRNNAFAASAVSYENVSAAYVYQSAFMDSVATERTCHIAAKVLSIQPLAFGYMRNIEHIIIGSPNEPTQLNQASNYNNCFTSESLQDITIYTDDVSNAQWSYPCFTDWSGMNHNPTVTIVQASN